MSVRVFACACLHVCAHNVYEHVLHIHLMEFHVINLLPICWIYLYQFNILHMLFKWRILCAYCTQVIWHYYVVLIAISRTLGSSVEKPQAVREDNDGSLQCVCYQRIAVWQRDMDYVCRAGEKAQHIPHETHPPCPGNILAGQIY